MVGWLCPSAFARSKQCQTLSSTVESFRGLVDDENNRPNTNVSDTVSEGKYSSRHEPQQLRGCLTASHYLQPTTLDNVCKIADSPNAEIFAEAFRIRVFSDEELPGASSKH